MLLLQPTPAAKHGHTGASGEEEAAALSPPAPLPSALADAAWRRLAPRSPALALACTAAALLRACASEFMAAGAPQTLILRLPRQSQPAVRRDARIVARSAASLKSSAGGGEGDGPAPAIGDDAPGGRASVSEWSAEAASACAELDAAAAGSAGTSRKQALDGDGGCDELGE
jgi:hypothetical protein